MRSTTRPAGSGSTGRSSPRPSTRPTTASSRSTLGEDGDPLDALVLVHRADLPRLPDPLPRDRHVPDDRRKGRRRQGPLRSVEDPRQEHLRDIHHLGEFDRLEIQHFFEVYKDLEPGKSVEGATWVGRTEAEAEILTSYQRAEDAKAAGTY